MGPQKKNKIAEMIRLKPALILCIIIISNAHGMSTESLKHPMSATGKADSANGTHPSKPRLSPQDDKFLDTIERAIFHYFWENADIETGLVLDRVNALGVSDTREIASVAATGLGLVALAIGYDREYEDRDEIVKRVELTLRYLSDREADGHEGFFYRYLNATDGERVWRSDISSMDTALLVAGALTVGHYFEDHDHIMEMAEQIYDEVNYAWMLNGEKTLRMSWNPEHGFGDDSWDRYSEMMLLVLQAVGSLTHPIPPSSWHAIKRELITYDNYTFINGHDPLFTHQYSHAFIDFRGHRDQYADYFENSVLATKAHKAYCIKELGQTYKSYNENFWGTTATDNPFTYDSWGGPPVRADPTGEIVPSTVGGSIPFLPNETIAVLRNLRYNYSHSAWGRYGFVDTFNPLTNATGPDVVGVDLGLTMLMAENYRTGFVWHYYMADEHVESAMKMVGFSDAHRPSPLGASRVGLNVALAFIIVAAAHNVL